MRSWVIASALFLSLSPSAWAQSAAVDTAPLPTYNTYLKQCLLSASKKAQSEKHLAAAGLVCQCSYERLVPHPQITRPLLYQALTQCGEEMVAQPHAFMDEYAPRLREGLRQARGL